MTGGATKTQNKSRSRILRLHQMAGSESGFAASRAALLVVEKLMDCVCDYRGRASGTPDRKSFFSCNLVNHQNHQTIGTTGLVLASMKS